MSTFMNSRGLVVVFTKALVELLQFGILSWKKLSGSWLGGRSCICLRVEKVVFNVT